MFEKLSVMKMKFEDKLQNRISDTNNEMHYMEVNTVLLVRSELTDRVENYTYVVL
jgi:hypothetical protein